MRKTLVVLSLILLPAALLAQGQAQPQAQTPASAPPKEATATGGVVGAGRVAVVDMQKAITENAEGQKAQDKFKGEVTSRQKKFEETQKNLTDAQSKLQTQDKALSDAAKLELNRQIDKMSTDLQRMNDDFQKELSEKQQELFRPIADKTQKVLQAYAAENGFGVVFDLSSQGSSIIHWSDIADITTEIIRRVDADAAKTPAPAAAAPKTAEPAKKQ